MPIDFRREHQVAWARFEASRLRVAFGNAIDIVEHVEYLEMTRGDRLMTITDPGGVGIPCAVCVTGHSPEGSLWRVELRPIVGADDDDVPATRAIQYVVLHTRYNTRIHATWDQKLGAASGADGWPDLAEGVTRLLHGDFRVHRRGEFGRRRSTQYATLSVA